MDYIHRNLINGILETLTFDTLIIMSKTNTFMFNKIIKTSAYVECMELGIVPIKGKTKEEKDACKEKIRLVLVKYF